MKAILIALFLSTSSAQALLLDFIDIKQANQAYEDKKYPLASKIYEKMDNDFARHNAANSLYRQGLYEQALSQYQLIDTPSLNFKNLHNTGNTYAQLGKINEAIKAYEQALQIKKDADTQFNLKLAKQQKKQQQKQKKDNKGKDKKTADKKDSKQNKGEKKSKKPEKKQNGDKKSTDKKQEKSDKKSAAQAQKTQEAQPISKLEERRWEKFLKQGVRTLILPLKSNNKHETNSTW